MAADSNPVASDQKKRTLEALERRFALAKAEHLQQQQKNQKRTREEDKGKNMDTSFVTSLMCETDMLAPPSSSTPFSKKGHFTLSSHTPSRGAFGILDVETNGPAYSQICQPVHETLLSAGVKLSNKRESIVNKIVHNLLQNGDSAQKYMQGSRSLKIDNWLLLDNVVQGRGVSSVGARIMALQNHSKRSKKHMSMKKHKKCGSFDFPHELQKFDIFKPMHEMWKDYIMQLLKNVGKSQLAQCLLTADLHGAILLGYMIAECKIGALTGVSGIMVRETAETFGIITQVNKFRVVPKRASVFIFQADCWKITLHGDKLTSRNLSS